MNHPFYSPILKFNPDTEAFECIGKERLTNKEILAQFVGKANTQLIIHDNNHVIGKLEVSVWNKEKLTFLVANTGNFGQFSLNPDNVYFDDDYRDIIFMK